MPRWDRLRRAIDASPRGCSLSISGKTGRADEMQFRFAVGEADGDAERLNHGGELAVEQRVLHLQVGEEDERAGAQARIPEMDTLLAQPDPGRAFDIRDSQQTSEPVALAGPGDEESGQPAADGPRAARREITREDGDKGAPGVLPAGARRCDGPLMSTIDQDSGKKDSSSNCASENGQSAGKRSGGTPVSRTASAMAFG